MRLKRLRIIAHIVLVLLGSGMALVAFFAYDLKLDNNPVMGSQRKALALIGLGCLALAASSPLLTRVRGRSMKRPSQGPTQAQTWVAQFLLFQQLSEFWHHARSSRAARYLGRHPEIWPATGALLVILISFWYITGGMWVWAPYSYYFDRQADAFLAGSLSLLEKPSAQLLALENPYDYRSREAVDYLWDASLYQGKYYLYWGPVPAIIASAAKIVRPARIEDQQLLMLFISGLALVTASLLHWLRKTLFPKTPAPVVLLLVLLGGLCAPVLWLVNRPGVYETAIAGGQFFLLLGLYAALRSLATPSRSGWLVTAGLAWGASVGCRVNNAIAVAWLAGLTVLFLLVHFRSTHGWVMPTLCLGIPLLAWAAGLGWYNLSRFGNLLETGHRYQLTGAALPLDYHLVISARYILPNLYNYLFRPLVFSWKDFPFVFAPFITDTMWPWFIRLPEQYYSTEPVAGILRSAPFFWLIGLALLRPVRAGWDWANERVARQDQPLHPLYLWCWSMVAGAALLSLGSLAVFISSTMRYLADIVPLMTVLAGLCIWLELDHLQYKPWLRGLLLAVVIVLGLASILNGIFLNFHIGDHRFEAINPQLYWQIVRFFVGHE